MVLGSGKQIPTCIEILQRDEVMPAIDHLINYSKDEIDLEMIDGMFVTSYVPKSTDDDTPELNEVFETMFQEQTLLQSHQWLPSILQIKQFSTKFYSCFINTFSLKISSRNQL